MKVIVVYPGFRFLPPTCLLLIAVSFGTVHIIASHNRSSPSFILSDSSVGQEISSTSLSQTERLEVFEKIWKDINEHYYDSSFGGLDWQGVHRRYFPLVEGATTDPDFYKLMSRMTGELHDAHTRVFSPQQWENSKKQQGVSVGFKADEVEGKLVITEVIPDSNAARVGLESGMIVLAIDGKPAAEKIAEFRKNVVVTSSDRLTQWRVLVGIFAGLAGTSLKLKLERADGTPFETMLQRQILPNSMNFSSRLLPSGVAYVRFDLFESPVANKLKDALAQFQNARGLIIDLRGNGGGSGPEMRAIAEYFYNSTTLFSRDTNRTGKPLSGFLGVAKLPLEVYVGHEGGQIYAGPVVILVSMRSGSSAELFAAGMQETGRATIVGTQSCGCVLGIWERRELKGGGELDISEVVWFTPKGRRLEGVGVMPDKSVVPAISDLQQKRDRVLAESEELVREMSTRQN